MAQKALELLPRQALHAKSLEFSHPISEKTISVDSDLPEDFSTVLQFLETDGR